MNKKKKSKEELEEQANVEMEEATSPYRFSPEQYGFLFEELSNKVISDDVATMINTLSISLGSKVNTNLVGFYSLLLVYDTLNSMGINQPPNAQFGILESQKELIEGVILKIREASDEYTQAMTKFKEGLREKKKQEMADQLASMQAQQEASQQLAKSKTKGEA